MKKIRNLIIKGGLVFMMFMPLIAFSAQGSPTNIPIPTGEDTLRSGTPLDFANLIIKWLLGLVGIILVGLIIYGGIVYATAAGNEERAGMGKKILTYAIVGVVIVFAAYVISNYVIEMLTS